MENSTAVLLISMMVLMMSLYYYETERKLLHIKAELTESETRCNQEVKKLREEKGSKILDLHERLEKVSAITREIDAKKDSEISALHKKIEKVSAITREIEDKLTVAVQKVAFHARLGKDLRLGSSQTVVFNNVYLNTGNGYNYQTGYFTAPIDGLYHFASSFLARGSEALHLQLMKNNVDLALGHAGAPNGEAGSILVTIELKKGDTVGIRHTEGVASQTIHESYSSFTGFKL